MAFLSRSNSHFAGWWLLIKNISSVLLFRWPRFFEQSARISSSMASSLNDPGGFDRFSARTFSSILVRMKKNFLSIELIFSASLKWFSRNRVSVNMRKAWYLSISTWSQYVSTGKFFSPHSRQIPELDIRIVWVIIWCWFFAALSDTNLGCLFVEVFKAEKKKIIIINNNNINNNNNKRRRVKKLVPGTTYATCVTALLLLMWRAW